MRDADALTTASGSVGDSAVVAGPFVPTAESPHRGPSTGTDARRAAWNSTSR